MNKPVCLELLREAIIELNVKAGNLRLVADALEQEIIKEKLEITLKEASISTLSAPSETKSELKGFSKEKTDELNKEIDIERKKSNSHEDIKKELNKNYDN